MDQFPAGSYSLSVEAPIGEGDNIARKSLPLELPGGDTTKDVEFAKLVAVSGRVTLGGKTPERPGSDAVTLLFRGVGAGAESKMVALDSDGKYQVQLEPGDYQVSLEDGPGKPVTVEAGAAQTVDLSF
jgi:hypothetical protein